MSCAVQGLSSSTVLCCVGALVGVCVECGVVDHTPPSEMKIDALKKHVLSMGYDSKVGIFSCYLITSKVTCDRLAIVCEFVESREL